MAKKQTLAGEKKKSREKAKKQVIKNAEIARKILNDPDYPIFKELFKKAANSAARKLTILERAEGGDVQEWRLRIKFLRWKIDFLRDLPNCPHDWLTTERNMKAEENVQKRYESA